MSDAAPEILPGIHRLSIPLPGPPHEVAAWLLRGDRGWILVDGGMDTSAARQVLRDGADRLGIGPGDLAQVVLTHAHIDHYGLAGRVRQWSGAPVAMHAREEALARRFVDRWAEDALAVAETFRKSGVPDQVAAELLAASDLIHRLYPSFHPDEQLVGNCGPLPGGGGWEWILTPGHSPGHVVLYHPERRVLISGDHVLPRISPNIGADLYAEDPLGDYLASLARLRSLPAERVLPSHGPPFTALARRIDEICAHHDARNARILRMLAEPRTAYQVSAAVFGSLPSASLLHALRETAAHLVYLREAGRVEEVDGVPVRWAAR